MNLIPNKTQFSEQDHADLRADVAAAKAANGLTEADIARGADVPASTLNAYLKGKYQGDNNAPAAALHKWLKAMKAASAISKQAPTAPSFLPLSFSLKIQQMLGFAHRDGSIVMIGGEPGTSKTSTARQYAAGTPHVWLATMDPSSRGVSTMLMELLAAMGEPESKGSPQMLARRVLAKASAAGGLIVIDEAQHLSEQAIEQLRAINDKAQGMGLQLGIALIGNEFAWSRVGTAGTKAAFAQVSSRISMRRYFARPIPADVVTLTQAWADVNGETVGARETGFMVEVSQRPGGLRNVEKTMKNAIWAARGNEEPLNLDHLQGAFAVLSGLERAA